MNIIFHCGLPKTGTTSIQSFMHKMPEDTGNSILYYPNGFKNGSIHHLEIAESLGCHPNFNQKAHVLAEHRNTIDSIASSSEDRKCMTLVFSCEVFSMNPCADRFGDLLVDGLNELFGTYAPDVTYLFYVRDPISWSVSMYNQLIRSGRIAISPSIFARKVADSFGAWDPNIHRIILGYQYAIKKIGGKISVRPFSRNLLLDGDVLSDFLVAIGCNSKLSSIRKNTFNKAESIDSRIIDIILDYSKRINRQLTFPEARNLSASLSRYFTGERQCLGLFTESSLLDLFNYYVPIYKALSAVFAADSKLSTFLDYCASDEYLLAQNKKLESLLLLNS